MTVGKADGPVGQGLQVPTLTTTPLHLHRPRGVLERLAATMAGTPPPVVMWPVHLRLGCHGRP